MKTEWQLEFSSTLAAPVAEVWQAVSAMRGVNDELTPWMRMTYPTEAAAASIAAAPTGEVLFRSWILLFTFLPIDRHSLQLTRVDVGHGFLEESSSWTQAYWRHHRTLESTPAGGCRVADRLCMRPRIRWFGSGTAWFIGKVFTNRHRQLRRRFGDAFAGAKPR